MNRRKWAIAATTMALSTALHAAAIGRLVPSVNPVPDLRAGGAEAIPLLGDSFADMAAGETVAPEPPTLSPDAATAALAPPKVSAKAAEPLIPAATLVKQPDESQPTLPGTTAKPAAQAALSPVTDASSPLPKPRPEAAKPAVKAKPKAVGNSDQNREKGVASGQVTGESATAKGKASAQAGDGGKAAASYASSVLRKISKTRKAKSPGKGRVVISFVVAENGALQATRVAKSSGNAKLDQVALDHIRRAAPFPPPPPSAKRNFAFEFIGTN